MKIKKSLKRKAVDEPVEKEELPPAVRHSDDPPLKKVKWINKQRVLVLALRGITYLNRHLMQDLRTLLPHSKKDNKVEKGVGLELVEEIAQYKNCNKCILFENRRKMDLYMWLANIGKGPTVKFQIENVYTMKELKLTGNCLKGSRPILSFDGNFSKEPQYRLMQELLVQIFSTPNKHPKSQPFTDHIMTFTLLDGKIWFRNYQILTQDGALAEIGPRFVMNPIKIFAGCFRGEVLWENGSYISRMMHRRSLKDVKDLRYENRKNQKEFRNSLRPMLSYDIPDMEGILRTNDNEETAEEEATPNTTIKKKKLKKRMNKLPKA